MADIIRQDMSALWAVGGDIQAPDNAKINEGWSVEVVPRQWWNWMQNRVDTNVAYLLQKGIPEWDATTEYLANKSYVTSAGVVYKCLTTNTGLTPASNPTQWARAFSDYSPITDIWATLTPAADKLPYFTGANSATTTTLTPFARTILDDTDALSVRTTISAQEFNSNLTALSSVAASANVLPYFTGTSTMGSTSLTSFGRTLIGSSGAPAARTSLGVYSTTETDTAISTGLDTRQPLDATLTAFAALSTSANTIPYFTGVDAVSTTSLTPFARGLLGNADAATMRTTLSVPETSTVQPLDATLTAFANLVTANNTMPYFTGVDTVSTTTLTPFARTILDDTDSASVRATIGAQPLDATLTALAGVTTAADQLIYSTGSDAFTTTTFTGYGRSIVAGADAAAVRTTLGLGAAAVRGVTSTGNVIAETSSTGAAQITKGTTAQRPTGVTGQFRFNTDTNRFEGYNSTSWGSLGGATGGGNDDAFYENTTTITTDYTITAGKNAGSFGPITINDGVTITIPTGSTWSIV